MDVNEIIGGARDAITVKRVYGDPIQQGDVIVIPAARIGGGAGGGSGQGPQGQGTGAGSGFGIGARPAGAFIISKGRVRWRPAVDANRIVLGGQLVAAMALLTLGRLIRASRARARLLDMLQSSRRRRFVRGRRARFLLRSRGLGRFLRARFNR